MLDNRGPMSIESTVIPPNEGTSEKYDLLAYELTMRMKELDEG